ncbi:lamin tail domain-containing protein [Alistipes sp. OttesenSCG-928-B03]|nr:lamin tail domain-containing protein [Alistipes sp. OttesenSCG-928-B03]
MKKLFYLTMAAVFTLAACSKDPDPDDGDGGGIVVPPGPTTSQLLNKLFLNEINVTDEDKERYIELYNYSADELALDGVSIRYRKAGQSNFTVMWEAPDTKLYSESFRLIKGMNGTWELQGTFGYKDGVIVELVDTNTTPETILDRFRIVQFDMRPAAAQNVHSFARISNGKGHWYYDSPLGTPRADNGVSVSGKSRIETTGDLFTPTEIKNVSLNPTVPNSSQSVSISATIEAGEGNVSGVTLKYWLNGNANDKKDGTISGSGSSYSGSIPAQPNGSIVNFMVTAVNNIGGQGIYEGFYVSVDGTPTSTGQVYINECDPGEKKWEFYNPGTDNINIGGWKLTKDPDDNGGQSFTFAENTIIPAGKYVVFQSGVSPGPSLGMSGKTGFRYVLRNKANEVVDDFDNYGDNIINDNIIPGQTLARYGDGSVHICTYITPTMGTANGTEGASSAVVAALMSVSSDDPADVGLLVGKSKPIFTANLTLRDNSEKMYVFFRNPTVPGWSYGGGIEMKLKEGTKHTYEGRFTGPIYLATAYKAGFGLKRGSWDSNPIAGTNSAVELDFEVTPPPYKYNEYIHISEVGQNSLQYIEIFNNSTSMTIPLNGCRLYRDAIHDEPMWTGGDSEVETLNPMTGIIIAARGGGMEDKADFVLDFSIPGDATFRFHLYAPGQQAGYANILPIADTQRVIGGQPYGTPCLPDYSNYELIIGRNNNQGQYYFLTPTPRADNGVHIKKDGVPEEMTSTKKN